MEITDEMQAKAKENMQKRLEAIRGAQGTTTVPASSVTVEEAELIKRYGKDAWTTYLNIFNTLLQGVLTNLNSGLGVLNLFHPPAALWLLDYLEKKITTLFSEMRGHIQVALVKFNETESAAVAEVSEAKE